MRFKDVVPVLPISQDQSQMMIEHQPASSTASARRRLLVSSLHRKDPVLCIFGFDQFCSPFRGQLVQSSLFRASPLCCDVVRQCNQIILTSQPDQHPEHERHSECTRQNDPRGWLQRQLTMIPVNAKILRNSPYSGLRRLPDHTVHTPTS